MQGHLPLHSKFKAIVCYVSPCLKKFLYSEEIKSFGHIFTDYKIGSRSRIFEFLSNFFVEYWLCKSFGKLSSQDEVFLDFNKQWRKRRCWSLWRRKKRAKWLIGFFTPLCCSTTDQVSFILLWTHHPTHMGTSFSLTPNCLEPEMVLLKWIWN